MSKVRGSFHVDGRRSLTVSTSATDKGNDVGFRLVFDDDRRVGGGGKWANAPWDPRVADHASVEPAYHSIYLGFRLARDQA